MMKRLLEVPLFYTWGIMSVLCILGMCAIALGGTWRNDCGSVQTYRDWDGRTDYVSPGDVAEGYIIPDGDCWVKIHDAPYVPLALSDEVITGAAGETVEVPIEPKGTAVILYNLGDANATIFLNSQSNPYPAVLEASSPNTNADKLVLKNEKTISSLFIRFGSSGTVRQVKIVEVP